LILEFSQFDHYRLAKLHRAFERGAYLDHPDMRHWLFTSSSASAFRRNMMIVRVQTKQS